MEPGLLWGLEPFIHQVGGHSPLFCLDHATVCKPYEEREHTFYSSMPDCLLAYTPQFKGSMRVHITEDQDGYITLRGFPPNSYCNSHNQKTNILKPKMRLKRCGSIEIERGLGEHCDQYFTDEKIKGEKLYNPWALKCHRDNLKKVGIHLLKAPSLTQDSPACQQYILLENLTSRQRHPCVLDLKVGTRQYGDGASASKKLSKNVKVASTTSGLLGLRLGGMQVYQVSLGRYICRTKNYGRSLSADGLKRALRQFFCNGLLVRTDVIQALLVKLAQLQKLLAGLDSYRFYTSSLLVTYDGSSSYQAGSLEWSPVPRNSFSTSSLLLIAGSDNCQARHTSRTRHRSAHVEQGSQNIRMLKRIVYTMVGTGGGAAVCYPEYAREGGELVYQEGRKNVMVAYNLLAGVEGGPTPSLPSLSDISNMGTSTDMSLIASTMRRVLYLAASKMKDVYQLGQQKLAVLLEKNINNEKDGTIDEAATAFTVPEIRVATTNNNSK